MDSESPNHTDLEQFAQTLEQSNDYKVLRRFKRRRQYNPPQSGEQVLTALFVDVETTGLSHSTDKIIEFAAVPFTFGKNSGLVYEIGKSITYLEDPEVPISAAITELTGITQEMVEGKRIDDDKVKEIVDKSSLIVAHNAGFDRKFLERRFPFFIQTYWACTYNEIEWDQHGCKSSKLEYIMYKHCGEFFDGHRADEDCYAGVHILATPFADGTLPMQSLLKNARTTSARIWATGAPIELKDLLKERGYKWNGTVSENKPRAWFRDIPFERLQGEEDWLKSEIYRGDLKSRMQKFTSRDRYSDRF